MKVFMVHEDPWHAGNPYIYTLIEGLRQQYPDCEIGWGREGFWSEGIMTYDIVHFHWPQTFMGNDAHGESDLQQHLERLRNKGVRIVATCHDLEPHYGQFADKAEAMRIVYSHSDAIIHLGTYSQRLFTERYPQCCHLLIPHHLYDTVYQSFPSREDSLRYLHLPADKRYVLCFGAFRASQEQQLVMELGRQLADSDVTILAPAFMNVWWRWFRLPNKLLTKAYYQHRYGIWCTGRTWHAVSDDALPYYYGAADAVFIQRLKILNSGNAVMPMLFGKVVVGPDCGNVGPLLREWGYPVFPVDDTSSVGSFVRTALEMGRSGLGSMNRERQILVYATSVITRQLHKVYQSLL